MCINVLLFQHWIIILLGIPIIPFTYIDLVRADKDLIEKFGDYCKAYTKEIPRANARIPICYHYDVEITCMHAMLVVLSYVCICPVEQILILV